MKEIMDTKQPEALHLAEMLEQEARLLLKPGSAAAAAELRRLHAENETMRAGYDAARLEIASLQAQLEALASQAQPVGAVPVTPIAHVRTSRNAFTPRKLQLCKADDVGAVAVFTHSAPQPAAQALDATNSLGELNAFAKRFADSYASPHHFTMSVAGLRKIVAALALDAQDGIRFRALVEAVIAGDDVFQQAGMDADSDPDSLESVRAAIDAAIAAQQGGAHG